MADATVWRLMNGPLPVLCAFAVAQRHTVWRQKRSKICPELTFILPTPCRFSNLHVTHPCELALFAHTFTPG